MKRLLTGIATILILGTLVWFAARTQDIARIVGLIKSANVIWFVADLFIAGVGVALSSTNIFFLLSLFGGSPPWRRLFELDLLSLLGVYYTPAGSGGYAFLVYMLKKAGIKPGDSVSCLVLDKIITGAFALLSLTVFLALYYGSSLINIDKAKLTVLGALACLALCACFWVPVTRALIKSFMDRCVILWRHPWILLFNICCTAGVFAIGAIHYLIAFKSVGIMGPSLTKLFFSYGPLSLLTYLPFTVSGAGVGEAAAAVIWSGPTVRSEDIIAVVLVARLFALASSVGLSGVVYMYRYARRSAIGVNYTA